jgi:hypothetical protein
MDGAGKVFAEVESVSDKVREKVAGKRLRYMSVEIYENDKVEASRPPYLRAIALLGRDTPAVAGARLPAVFSLAAGGIVGQKSGEENIAVFSQKLNADVIKTFSAETGKGTEEENVEELEKLKAEFAAQNERLAALQKENENLKNAGKQSEALAFFGELRDGGRLAPALCEKAVALDTKLGEEERRDFRALFAGAGTVLDLSGNHAAPKGKAPEAGTQSAGLTAKVRAFQKEKGIATFADAADAFYAAHPEAFEEEGGKDD